MRKIRLLFLLIFSTLLTTSQAQPIDTVTISFKLMFGHQQLLLNDVFYPFQQHDSIRINRFRFYISGISFCLNNDVVYKEANSYHLVDAAEPATLQIALQLPHGVGYNSLHFQLGIDSATNVSGALGGDLDPTKGMYWTWQSGYINVKLEGNSNLCNTRKNEFEFHIGGYNGPANALQSVALSASGKKVEIVADVAAFFAAINLSAQHHLMTPGKDAVALAAKMRGMFSIQP